jgi:hypothetical protein
MNNVNISKETIMELRDLLLKWRQKILVQREELKSLVINDEPLEVIEIQLKKCLAMHRGYERYLERWI